MNNELKSVFNEIFKNDDVTSFLKIYEKEGFPYEAFLAINSLLKVNAQKKYDNASDELVKKIDNLAFHSEVLNLISTLPINWKNFIDNEKYITTDSLYHLSTAYVATFDKLIGNIAPQWLKDTWLNNSVFSLILHTTQYLLENGADIELKSLDVKYNLLLTRHITPSSTKNYANAQEIRELLTHYWPHKNSNNVVWNTLTEKYLENSSETGLIKLNFMIVHEYIYPKNKKHDYKFANSLSTLNEEDALKILTSWHKKNLLTPNLITNIYKCAVLNNNKETINILLNQKLDEKPFLKSQAFKNIMQDGSLIAKYPHGLRNSIKSCAEKIKIMSLYEKLEETMAQPEAAKVKKNKI